MKTRETVLRGRKFSWSKAAQKADLKCARQLDDNIQEDLLLGSSDDDF